MARDPAWEPETLTPGECEAGVWNCRRQSPPTTSAFWHPGAQAAQGLVLAVRVREVERVGCQGSTPEAGEHFPVNSLTYNYSINIYIYLYKYIYIK